MGRKQVFFLSLSLCSILMMSCDSSDFNSNNATETEAITSYTNNRMSDTFYASLAQRWAPIHYQDVDNSGCGSMTGRGDYITAINFDNDWISNNNWNNIDRSKGHVPLGHSY